MHLKNLSPAQRKILQPPAPPPTAADKYRDRPSRNRAGVKWGKPDQAPADFTLTPDCRETKVSLKDLLKAAADPRVTSQTDFFRSLPKNSLQTFTLITKSESPEAPCISEKYPGVLRMSIDGSIAIRYTCDPNCHLYNQTQVLHFNQENRKWEPVEINLTRPLEHRTNLQPKSCTGCHSTDSQNPTDLRPNWAQYPFWKGILGGNDDNLAAAHPQDRSLSYQANYFLEFQNRLKTGDLKDNLCYQDLPWYKGTDPKYAYYPYAKTHKPNDYNLRPNLRITEVLSHRTAQRAARKMEESPQYQKSKFKIMHAALECDATARPSAKPSLVVAAEALGLNHADFTMHYNQPNKLDYKTGIAPEFVGSRTQPNDPSIPEVTMGELLKGLAREDSSFTPYLQLSRGETGHFGAQFSCIDDLGGRITLNDLGKTELCALLEKKDQESRPSPQIVKVSAEDCEEDKKNIGEATPRLIQDSLAIVEKLYAPALDPIKVQAGKETTLKVCASCHGAQNPKNLKEELLFLKDEKSLRSHLCDSSLLQNAKARMNDEYDPMPPFGSGFDHLKKQDLDNVDAYLRSVAKRCP